MYLLGLCQVKNDDAVEAEEVHKKHEVDQYLMCVHSLCQAAYVRKLILVLILYALDALVLDQLKFLGHFGN